MMSCQCVRVCLLALFLCLWQRGECKTPRGVSPDNADRYVTGQLLTCGGADHGKTVPYKYINDDYCDCPGDGADEPGTSACPNGSFYCPNKGYKPLSIPSSRVNDRICDCCDGSDEYEDLIDCSNSCHDIGRVYREELLKKVEDSNAGFNTRQQYIDDNKDVFTDKQEELDKITQQIEILQELQKQLQDDKDSKEVVEKEAIEQHRLLWEEKKKAEDEDWMLDRAQAAFAELDNDRNGIVTHTELEEHTEFDIDYSGAVSEDEASWVLSDDLQTDIQQFVHSVWPRIHQSYRWEENGTRTVVITSDDTTDSDTTDSDTVLDDTTDSDTVLDNTTDSDTVLDDTIDSDTILEDDTIDSDLFEDDTIDSDLFEDDTIDSDLFEDDTIDSDLLDDDEFEIGGGSIKTVGSVSSQPYDEYTQSLVDVAKTARNTLKTHEKKVRELKTVQRQLEKVVGIDFGPHNVFYAINEQCFEYRDREYVYKLCTFSKVTQKPLKGGSETNLGNWEQWVFNNDDNSYIEMKYNKGQKCWNGPDRSTMVHLTCGNENIVTSVSEPNKCEYRLDFTTPAACSELVELTEDLHIVHNHDEL